MMMKPARITTIKARFANCENALLWLTGILAGLAVICIVIIYICPQHKERAFQACLMFIAGSIGALIAYFAIRDQITQNNDLQNRYHNKQRNEEKKVPEKEQKDALEAAKEEKKQKLQTQVCCKIEFIKNDLDNIKVKIDELKDEGYWEQKSQYSTISNFDPYSDQIIVEFIDYITNEQIQSLYKLSTELNNCKLMLATPTGGNNSVQKKAFEAHKKTIEETIKEINEWLT